MITLGFNYSQMHDSSTCIARNGEVLFAVAEERISQIEHDPGFPRLAARGCPDAAKASFGGYVFQGRIFERGHN